MVHGEYASYLKPFFYPKKYKKKKEQKRGGKEREREWSVLYCTGSRDTVIKN
jgi:hypothetical protein